MSGISYEAAQTKLTEYVNKGRGRSQQTVKALMDESASRVDLLVRADIMRLFAKPDNLALVVQNRELTFSQWAEDQMLMTLGIPQKFIAGLQKDGEVGLAVANDVLNSLYYRVGTAQDNRRLIRVVNDTVKGWLSPNYAIIDQGEILGGFAAAIQNHANKGILFTDGIITDRRYSVTAIWPRVFQPWEGEAVIIGADLQSSDYGFGAVDLKQKVIRLVCINGAIGVSYFKKRHVGGNGYGDDGDPIFSISEQTRQLNAAATVSLMTDAITGAFADTNVDKILSSYRTASNKEIDPEQEVANLRKRNVITVDEAKIIPAMLMAPIEALPNTTSKNSALRFGQLLSMMSQNVEGERVLDLQLEAGKYYLPDAA